MDIGRDEIVTFPRVTIIYKVEEIQKSSPKKEHIQVPLKIFEENGIPESNVTGAFTGTLRIWSVTGSK